MNSSSDYLVHFAKTYIIVRYISQQSLKRRSHDKIKQLSSIVFEDLNLALLLQTIPSAVLLFSTGPLTARSPCSFHFDRPRSAFLAPIATLRTRIHFPLYVRLVLSVESLRWMKHHSTAISISPFFTLFAFSFTFYCVLFVHCFYLRFVLCWFILFFVSNFLSAFPFKSGRVMSSGNKNNCLY
jgi:hypothetical protein